MSNTSEGKIKLSDEQKRRDAFTARSMMSASHVLVADSPSSSVEHERRAQPRKRARIASEAESFNSTVMQHVATQGPPGADTTSETNMRDSSKRQADVGVEELDQDTGDGGDKAATLGDDAEMDVESLSQKSKSPLRAMQLKNTNRLKESLTMDIASVRFPDCVPRNPMF